MTGAIIGIAGQIGAGKDTVAGLLRAHHHCALIAFADPLKAFVQQCWDVPEDVLWGPSERRKTPLSSAESRWLCESHAGHAPFPLRTRHSLSDAVAADRWCSTCAPGRRMRGTVEVRTPTARDALQLLGTEWGRALDPDVWINLGLRRAQQLLAAPWGVAPDGRGIRRPDHLLPLVGRVAWPPYIPPSASWVTGAVTTNRDLPRLPGVVISDVRFHNECEAVRAAGGIVWRVERDAARPPESAVLHGSEAEVANLNVDHVIDNNGTLHDLGETVGAAWELARSTGR